MCWLKFARKKNKNNNGNTYRYTHSLESRALHISDCVGLNALVTFIQSDDKHRKFVQFLAVKNKRSKSTKDSTYFYCRWYLRGMI
jgi:hypothetical protein